MLLKLLLSIRRRRKPELAFRHHSRGYYIHGVVTSYNEAPAMLRRCLESILGQTLLMDSLTVVDDCSTDMSCAALIHEMRPQFERAGVRLDFIRFPDNRGKRHGLAAGFEMALNADMYMCVDSDTVLDQHAVAELAEPFSKRRVHCVTGLVLAHNRSTNLLTRLIDMRYVNAFLGERVAYSRLGSVLCACGSLAMYRGWVVRKYLDDFLDQRFLGRPATFGDDRRLTYYCLTEGFSLIQPSSVGYTDVPERLGHYIRQQIRWGKSFIREGFLLFGKFRITRMYWWLNLVELVTWVVFTVALLSALIVIGTHPTSWRLLVAYLGYMCVMAWVRSVHYLRGAVTIGFFDRMFTFLCAPLYAVMNLSLLLPLRLWSLATLRSTNWGTRATVEVGGDEQEGLAGAPVGQEGLAGAPVNQDVLVGSPVNQADGTAGYGRGAGYGDTGYRDADRGDAFGRRVPAQSGPPGMPMPADPYWDESAPLLAQRAQGAQGTRRPGNMYEVPAGERRPYAPEHPAPSPSGYVPENGYAPEGSYVPQGGYVPEAGHAPEPGYVPEYPYGQ